jgi:hypothetical protein
LHDVPVWNTFLGLSKYPALSPYLPICFMRVLDFYSHLTAFLLSVL